MTLQSAPLGRIRPCSWYYVIDILWVVKLTKQKEKYTVMYTTAHVEMINTTRSFRCYECDRPLTTQLAICLRRTPLSRHWPEVPQNHTHIQKTTHAVRVFRPYSIVLYRTPIKCIITITRRNLPVWSASSIGSYRPVRHMGAGGGVWMVWNAIRR